MRASKLSAAALRRAGMALAAVVAVTTGAATMSASAAAPLTVAAALSAQDGRSAAVTGYIVGQPTATNTVIKSGFTGDTAFAIADSAAESSTSRMLYVQVTAAYRSAFGLQSNPGLMGRSVTVTGTLTAYFSHGGLKDPTAMSLTGSSPRRRPARPDRAGRTTTRTTPARSARPGAVCAPRCTTSSRCRRRSPTTRCGRR
ncbi:DUF6359 domain-containing protein [Catellatospora bangladeshensis]|uniref:DUF6359 domain-containing protein n=1 Tax=Catellatospora bangladeshensis TaxID=310355 RepID=UPI0036210601